MATRATTRAKTATRHKAPKVFSLRDKILQVAPDFKDKYGKVQVCYVAEAVFGSQRKCYRTAINQVLDNAGIPRRRKLKPELPPPVSNFKPLGSFASVPAVQLKPPQPVEVSSPLTEQLSIDVPLFLAKRAKEGSLLAFDLLRKLV